MVDTRKFATQGDKSLLGVEGALQSNAILQNRYRIEGVLGVGGMGSVYQARDMQFPDARRYVAVKEMLHLTSDPDARNAALRNFHREANILAALNHPAIPTVHDYFSTKDRAYVVMEFVNGSDLDEILNRHIEGFLPVQQVVEWCITLCDVLDYLHTSDPAIIFRDVKPSNIMIDVYGRLRLIDFGIAKHFQPETKGTMIGTEGYAAPESYKGMATPSSDIFGVGATMHHVLTNHDPRREAPFTFAERPIRSVNEEVPPPLEAIVMKALSFNAEDRFASAADMKQALENLLGTRTTGGLATIAAPTMDHDSWDESAKVDAGPEPRWKFKVEEEIRSMPLVYNNTVYVTVYDNNLYAVDAEVGQLKWKFPAEDILASSPTIAPEENLVIFGSKDFNLYAIDIRTGRQRWKFEADGPIYSSPTVRHSHVFFGSEDGNLYAVRLATGRAAWKQQMHDAIRVAPAVTEDLIIYGTQGGELFAVDLSGQTKWRFRARKAIMSSPRIHEGVAYFGSMDGHVYAVDIQSGWSVWRNQTSKPVVSTGVVAEGKLFIGSANGKIYAFELDNGREKWSVDLGAQITSSPAYFDGAIYVGANDNKIYSLETKNGKERWSYETGGIIPGSPVVEDGVVYIGSTDQFLYAFKA